MPQSLPKTLIFNSVKGPLRIVADGDKEPFLETPGGLYVGQCRYTGPEILKLSEQGWILWSALRACTEVLAVQYGTRQRNGGAGEQAYNKAREALRETAATFDHPEPEERPRRGWEEPEPESHPAPQSFTPKFGERLRGIHASEANPQRDGLYVRTIRRTGRLNAGVWFELTDGLGNFWEYPAESVARLSEGGV